MESGVPGIWIAYTKLPPPPEGPEKKKRIAPIFFFTFYLCNNRTEEAYPRIKGKQRNITSHPSYDILYLVLFCGLLLGCTLHGRVVNGHICICIIVIFSSVFKLISSYEHF